MINKHKKLLAPLLLILITILLIVICNRYYQQNRNIIKVTTESPLKENELKIYFGIAVNTINRESDLDVFDDINKYTILYDAGSVLAEPVDEYGENDFLITYDDAYYYTFRHFKLNRKNKHLYTFKVKKEESNIVLYVSIKGRYSMSFMGTMIPIKDAEDYRCNVLKDKAGSFYNMTELKN